MSQPKNYFIIPGNPPAVYFYEKWKNEMLSSGVAKVEVSHYPLILKQKKSKVALTEIEKKHLEQFLSFKNEVQGEVTIIGHSLGAYFSLKLLEQVENKIQMIILLHPFIRAPGLKGKTILNVVGSFYGQENFHRMLIKSRKSLELFSKNLTFVSNDEIIKSFHLARHESRTIGVDTSKLEIAEKLKDKINVYYSKKDVWCGPEIVSQLKEQVCTFECSEPHDFITHEKHRHSLFYKIHQR